MTSPLLEVKDLTLHFRLDRHVVVEALDRVNFFINPGEILGLVGESGCGKTTAARAILGVVPSPPGELVSGQILFQGQDLVQMSPRQLNTTIRGKAITMIPQDTIASLNPLFTVGTQMLDIMRWKGTQTPTFWSRYSWKRKRQHRSQLIDMLRQVQIPTPERQLRKFPHEFSGGQRQRLLIAMALSTHPDLLIADEPTTALDVTIQAQILQLLKRLVRNRGVSVLFITHDLGVVARLCDRVTVMYAGQEMESAPTASLFSQPSHPYTQKLLESLPDPGKEEMAGIPGVVPSLINPPQGCRFHTRCEFADDTCRQERPPAVCVAPQHTVRCHLYDAQGKRRR
ncbi:MAG: ABC transporter ATP-binding protein [Nitrospinota bacterium]|nr:MAG: ABC transporter ATP-binding protein [Nitrospinota bacterium]